MKTFITPRWPLLRACLFVIAASVCSTLAAASQGTDVPAIPKQPGAAAGTVSAGTANVTLRHAYALGPIDWGGQVYQIVLTDKPIPKDAIGKELERGGQPLLKAGKLQGITLLVDDTGFVMNIVPYIGELRGSRMLASAGRLKAFAAGQGRTTGQGSATSEGTGQGWSYAASWNAALLAADLPGAR